MIYDIRAKDKVRLKVLNEEQKEKLKKFISRRISGANDAPKLTEIIRVNEMIECNFSVLKVSKTQKTNTEFALLKFLDGNYKGCEIKVQTKYLSLLSRQRSHQITSIFL